MLSMGITLSVDDFKRVFTVRFPSALASSSASASAQRSLLLLARPSRFLLP
jgi:hypothetical protein